MRRLWRPNDLKRQPVEHGIGRIAASLRRPRRQIAARKKIFAVLLAVSVVIFCMAMWPIAKADLQSMAVLDEVAGRSVPWLPRQFTAPIVTHTLSFPIESPTGRQMVRARLYLPIGKPNAPAMVIFHGVHHLGIDEPRLMGFAAAMASCGLRVLTPELPDIKDYHVSGDSVQTIGGSVQWFAKQTGGPVGVMGLSFSGGLALIAAADPHYRTVFKFILTVGAQDSMYRVSEYYRTGRDVRPDGTIEVLPPNEYGLLVLEYEYLSDLVSPTDLDAVRAVLREHLYEDSHAEAEAMDRLSPAQKHEAFALMDTKSVHTQARVAAVVSQHTAEMNRLSPQSQIENLRLPVYLLHGEDDNVIPSAESLWIASELPRDDLKEMLICPLLSHLDLDSSKPSAMDEWQLLRFFAEVMQEAEKPPPPTS